MVISKVTRLQATFLLDLPPILPKLVFVLSSHLVISKKNGCHIQLLFHSSRCLFGGTDAAEGEKRIWRQWAEYRIISDKTVLFRTVSLLHWGKGRQSSECISNITIGTQSRLFEIPLSQAWQAPPGKKEFKCLK